MVRRLPRVNGAAQLGEPGQVFRGFEEVDVAGTVAAQPLAPARGVAEPGEEGVAGGGVVAGDLEGEGATGAQPVDPGGEGAGVARDPLEGSVGNDQVVGLLGEPVREVAGAEVEAAAAGGLARVLGIGAPEHLRGQVEAGDAGVGPAIGEERGDVAGSAAEVGDAGGAGRQFGYPVQEVEEGSGSVSCVPEVLLRVPGGRGLGGGGGNPCRRGIGMHVRASLLAWRAEAEAVPAPSMPIVAQNIS